MDKKPVNLKRYFLMLIAWVVTVVAIIGGAYLYNAYQGSQYEASAVPYVEQVVPVLAEWNEEKTRSLVAPEFLSTIPPENIGKAMELFSRLGTLERMEKPEFDEVVELPGEGDEEMTLVTYTVATHFSNGPARFRIQLIDRGDHFQLYNFNLSSETLTGAAR